MEFTRLLPNEVALACFLLREIPDRALRKLSFIADEPNSPPATVQSSPAQAIAGTLQGAATGAAFGGLAGGGLTAGVHGLPQVALVRNGRSFSPD